MKASKRRGKARVGISIIFFPNNDYPNKKVRTGNTDFFKLFLFSSDTALSNFLREENHDISYEHTISVVTPTKAEKMLISAGNYESRSDLPRIFVGFRRKLRRSLQAVNDIAVSYESAEKTGQSAGWN